MIAASRHHADDSAQAPITPAAARFALIAACALGLGFLAAKGFIVFTHGVAHAQVDHATPAPPVHAPSFWGKLAATPAATSIKAPSLGSPFARSAGPCVQAAPAYGAKTTDVPRSGPHAAAGHFDSVAIASFLHAFQRPSVRLRHRRTGARLALATTRLQADGVAGPAGPDAAVAVPQAATVATSPPSDPSLAFDTRLGRIKTAANAGVLNGQPAAALGIALTQGPFVLNATGMSEVTNLSEPGSFRKTFKVSTKASIPFD